MSDKEKNIYDLELHETLKLNINSVFTLVMRVPGGWNYVYDVSVVFIPFDKEFCPKDKIRMRDAYRSLNNSFNSLIREHAKLHEEFHKLKESNIAKDIANHIKEELELTKVWCNDCDLASICTLKLKQYTNAVTCPEYRDNLPF